MDSLLNRYRNLTVLLLVIFAQLVLLAYQVKGNQDVRLIRVWAVTAVTPLARVIEGVRSGTMHTLENYVLLRNLDSENRRMKAELGKLKLENVELKNQLETADRLKALASFQADTPSKTVPARVIGAGTGANDRVIFVDKGSAAGIMKGMAVITPDGIVGKVTASYPTASQILLITDPRFAAGVISQRHRVHGTLHGLPQGGTCQVEYVQNEEKVEPGELFFTSGDDRIFPKGFPVGVVTAVRPGQYTKQIFVRPTGVTGGVEEVLIVVEGVHQPIPEYQAPSPELHLTPLPPPDQAAAQAAAQAPADPGAALTEADRLREQYKKVGEAQNHVFGEGLPGSKPPDFRNLNAPQAAQGAKPPAGAGGTGQANRTAVPGTAAAPAPRPVMPPAAAQQPPRTGAPVTGTAAAPARRSAGQPAGTAQQPLRTPTAAPARRAGQPAGAGNPAGAAAPKPRPAAPSVKPASRPVPERQSGTGGNQNP